MPHKNVKVTLSMDKFQEILHSTGEATKKVAEGFKGLKDSAKQYLQTMIEDHQENGQPLSKREIKKNKWKAFRKALPGKNRKDARAAWAMARTQKKRQTRLDRIYEGGSYFKRRVRNM